MSGKAVNWSETTLLSVCLIEFGMVFVRMDAYRYTQGLVTPCYCQLNHIEENMKSLLSFSLRCLDALLWSLGLSSVVLVLMLGFYLCWTMPLTKDEPTNLADKPEKAKMETKAVMVTLDNNSVFADR